MKNLFLKIYRFVFLRNIFYKLNEHLYKISLRGIGILNSEGDFITGEKYFLEKILKQIKPQICIDVGANVGNYSLLLNKNFKKAQIYSFEPHPVTFKKLEANTKNYKNIKIFNLALSDKNGKLKLYDLADGAKLKHSQPTSTLSSIYEDVIGKIHKQKSQAFNINVEKLDDFAKKNKLTRIDFLKIDTEGSEYQILLGAKILIKHNKIKIIQFEFNEMNVYSRVFFKDFYELLENYNFYRLMPQGLFPIKEYRPKLHEIFAFQNYVAIRKDIKLQ